MKIVSLQRAIAGVALVLLSLGLLWSRLA